MIRLVFDLIYLYRMYPVMEIAQTMTQQNGNCASLCKIPSAAFASRKRGFLFVYERRKRRKGSSTAEEAKLSAENAKAKQWRTVSKAGKRPC